MEIRSITQLAKAHIEEIYAQDDIQEVVLEEVEFGDHGSLRITIGFLRAEDRHPETNLRDRNGLPLPGRSYKTVHIKDGRIKSVTTHPAEYISKGQPVPQPDKPPQERDWPQEKEEAIQIALTLIDELYEEDHIQEVSPDEVKLDEDDSWRITIGFLRAEDRAKRKPEYKYWDGNGRRLDGRSYKTVRIKDGQILSVATHPVERISKNKIL